MSAAVDIPGPPVLRQIYKLFYYFINVIFTEFFEDYGEVGGKFPCWVSHLDPNIAITELDLRRLKREVNGITYTPPNNDDIDAR